MTIKKISSNKQHYSIYLINGEKYRAYEIGNLPTKFGTNKVDSWLQCNKLGSGHAGLTFISEDYFPTWG